MPRPLTRLTVRFAWVLVASWCVMTAPCRAATPVVEASIEPALISMGESAQLTITGSANAMDAIKLPEVSGLTMHAVGQSRHIQIINGAMFSTTSIIVRVTPQSPGIYMIPGITQQPLELRVNPEGSAANTQPGGAPGAGGGFGAGKSQSANAAGVRMNADGSAFIKLVLPKRDIFVGESVPVDIELGLREGFAQPNGMPTLTGSDFTLNNLTHQPEQTHKIIDGKPYAVLTWHSVLAAIKPGTFSLTVDTPLTVRVRTAPARDSMLDDMLGDPFMQNFFGASVTKEITLSSPATELKVLELPTLNRPANFSGAVGQFKIAGELSAPSAAAGDPLTLKLHVSGTGNFDRVDSPMLEHIDQWKTYPPKSSFKSADALGNKGEKTFEQPIIAMQPGPQSLPPLTFSYFDPVTRKYETARSSSFDVSIAPALADSTAPAGIAPGKGAADTAPPATQDGLKPDHADTGARPTHTLLPLYLQPRFLAVPSLLALAFAAGWIRQRRRAAPRTRPSRRARTAAQATERALRDIESAAREGDARRFLALARAALAAGHDAEPDLSQLFALADEAQYSGHAPERFDFERWLGVVRTRMSDARSPPRSATAASVATLFIGICLAAAQASPARAAAAATSADTGFSATALYNQGNAYARAGKPGLAVLNYERARVLAPDDPDIVANLETVRAAAHLPPDPPNALARAITTIGPSAAACLGVAGMLLVGGGLLARPFARRAVRGGAVAAGVLLMGVTVGHAAVLWRTLHSAVVLASDTAARASPVPMGEPLFVLAEGQTVDVIADHEDFLLIKTAAGRSGWVSHAAAAMVVPAAADTAGHAAPRAPAG